MKTRVIAAAVLLPLLLIIVLVLPDIFTALLFGAMAAIAAYELLYNTGLINHSRLVIYSMVMAFMVSMWCYFDQNYAWGLLGLLAFCVCLFGEMMGSHVKIRFDHLALCFVAGLIIPFLLTSIVRIHATAKIGRYLVLIPFVLAFASDSGAYFVGIKFGRHKLAPVISPKKTVEGMVGGVLAAMIVMMIYAVILQLGFKLQVNYLCALVYGFVCSLGGVFGDLCFSVIKRQTGIKDYGNLIPGHGGILDRFDSMMIVGPLVEVLLLLLPVAVR